MTIIGLTGYAQSGKDTLGAELVKLGYQRVAFADGVREALHAINPIIGKTPDDVPIRVQDAVAGVGWDEAKQITEVRQLLQRVGTEGGRKIHGDSIWIDLALSKCAAGGRYVITDVRFPNEAEVIRQRGGTIVRLNRPGVAPANGHASELLVDEIRPDVVFTNGGSLDDVTLFARRLASSLTSPAA